MRSITSLISAGGECEIERDSLNNEYKYLIGVDSGVSHLYKLFFRPTHLIGDLDSISEKDLERVKKDNTTFIELEENKDKSDLEAALELALGLNSDNIVLIGGEKGEVDQLFGIFALCAAYSDKLNIKWMNKGYDIFFQNEITIGLEKGNLFSIVPVTKLENVFIKGALWNLNGETIQLGSSRTLRNESTDEEVYIKIENGKAAIIVKT